MSWVRSLQSMLPRPERRGDDEIDDDLADEFAFHLQQSERDLAASGEGPEAARAIARRRFGNIEDITRRCRRIALEERIMLQRFNAVMMVVVGVLVAGLAVQVWIMQRDNASALREITSQLARMKAAPAETDRSSADQPASSRKPVAGEAPPPGASSRPPSGVWREIDEAENVVETGARLVVMDLDDPHNSKKTQGGVLVLAGDGPEIGVAFQSIDARPINVTIMRGDPGRHRSDGGLWTLEGRGTLSIIAPDAFEGRVEPLRFKRTGDVPAAAYAANPASNGGMIHLMGDVTRPGAYALPAMGELSLRRLIASAGGAKDAGPLEVRVSAMSPTGERTERYRHADFLADPAADILILPGDLVEVTLGNKPAPADAGAEAAREKARADAVTAFLREMLVASDPNVPQVKMQDVLDHAACQVETSFVDQPEVQAQLRAIIEENRKRLADSRKSSTTTQPEGKP